MKVHIQNGPEFEIHEGETLLSAMGRAGISVAAPCGGKQRCGKCEVKILDGRVRDLLTGEVFQNSATEKKSLTVLACRSIPVTNIVLSPISENKYEGGEYERLVSSGKSLDAHNKSDNQTVSRASVALDIGTTTVSARLLDTGGEQGEIDTYSALNRQRVFGADVMSRINAAREGRTKELFSIINYQTKEMLLRFMSKFNLQSIQTLAVAANTTMLHLFVNEDPSSMGELPFSPVFLEERVYRGEDLSLPADKIIIFPSVSAFVGGDIVSGLGEINILEAAETTLFIDIGTNGEMVLSHNSRLFCTSAAAGPALEGAEISCGVGSITGGINRVQWIDGNIRYDTIGRAAPAGICGCGLIDAIALMLDRGIIDETGAFCEDDREDFTIAPGISLTNRDVRQYQLAKSAILSAIKILCKNAGTKLNDVKKIYVAGGLGFYIDQKAAVRTGLLPAEFMDRVEICGNSSLKGAVKIITNPGFIDYCREIKKRCVTMELASDPAFMDAFAENMIFPY